MSSSGRKARSTLHVGKSRAACLFVCPDLGSTQTADSSKTDQRPPMCSTWTPATANALRLVIAFLFGLMTGCSLEFVLPRAPYCAHNERTDYATRFTMMPHHTHVLPGTSGGPSFEKYLKTMPWLQPNPRKVPYCTLSDKFTRAFPQSLSSRRRWSFWNTPSYVRSSICVYASDKYVLNSGITHFVFRVLVYHLLIFVNANNVTFISMYAYPSMLMTWPRGIPGLPRFGRIPHIGKHQKLPFRYTNDSDYFVLLYLSCIFHHKSWLHGVDSTVSCGNSSPGA
jgi:hypothetical protein